jgi:lipopolysaccharide transport system permease protein
MERLKLIVFNRRLAVLKDLSVQLVIRDLKLRYRRTIVGLAWSFVYPLGQVLVLTFVFTLVIPTRVTKYSAFVAIGVLVWTWFQSSLVMAATAITGNRDLVRRPGFPAAVLPASTVGTNLIQFLMAVPALIAVVVYDGGHLGGGLALLPLVIAVQFVFTLGIAYLVASLNVSFRDTQQVVTLLLLLLFFLTPVFYDVSNVPLQFQSLYRLNPFVSLLDAYRTTLVRGQLPDLVALGEVALIGAAIAVLGHLLFSRASHQFAEEI